MADNSRAELRDADSSPRRFVAIGDVIDGRYRLDEVLNAGGMGVIMRARQLAMDRDVAIKLLLPQNLGDQETRTRFEREVHLAKQLTHPNIIRLYDFGKTEDLLYVVMELLEGEDLKAVIDREERLPIGRMMDVAMQVADALTDAHDRNIVHRDLKPANIFVTRLGSNREFVKVLDFGIAKSLDSRKFDVTTTGEVSGTVPYMSPEAITGKTPGKASDVYACAVIMLEMLTGRAVFEGHTVGETLMNHLNMSTPIPPTLATTPLAEIIRKATAKEPEDRYQDAARLLRALNDISQALDPLQRIPEREIIDVLGPPPEDAFFPDSDEDLDIEGDIPPPAGHSEDDIPTQITPTPANVFDHVEEGEREALESAAAEYSEPAEDDDFEVSDSELFADFDHRPATDDVDFAPRARGVIIGAVIVLAFAIVAGGYFAFVWPAPFGDSEGDAVATTAEQPQAKEGESITDEERGAEEQDEGLEEGEALVFDAPPDAGTTAPDPVQITLAEDLAMDRAEGVSEVAGMMAETRLARAKDAEEATRARKNRERKAKARARKRREQREKEKAKERATKADADDLLPAEDEKEQPEEPKLTASDYYEQARAAFVSKNPEKTIALCRLAVAKGNSQCYSLMALSYRQMGEMKKACKYYEKAGIDHKDCQSLQRY